MAADTKALHGNLIWGPLNWKMDERHNVCGWVNTISVTAEGTGTASTAWLRPLKMTAGGDMSANK